MRHPDDPHRTILFADDNVDALTLYGMIIEKMGYKVLKAQRTDHIYQILETEIPDLVIVGTWVNSRPFSEVVTELRQHPVLCSIPLVVMSYITNVDSVALAYAAGADYFQDSPAELYEFMTMIQSFVA